MSTSETNNAGNKPVITHWDSGVYTKVWQNKSAKGHIYYGTKIGKIYTDPDTGETKDSDLFFKGELLKARFLLDEAYRSIGQMEALDVQPEQTKPPIVKDHTQAHATGLQAQHEAVMNNLPEPQVPQAPNGQAADPVHAQGHTPTQ